MLIVLICTCSLKKGFPMRLLVVVPTHNEADALPVTMRDLQRYLPDSATVLIVDNGSTDNTAVVARKLGFAVLCLAEAGKAIAVKEALHYGLSHGWTHFIVFDADGQHPSGSVTEVAAMLEDCENVIVKGTRFSSGPPEGTPIERIELNSDTRAVLRSFGCSLSDPQCGLLGFSSFYADFFLTCMRWDYYFELEMIFLLWSSGRVSDVVELPISTQYVGLPGKKQEEKYADSEDAANKRAQRNREYSDYAKACMARFFSNHAI